MLGGLCQGGLLDREGADMAYGYVVCRWDPNRASVYNSRIKASR
jgi:hypothetical protein